MRKITHLCAKYTYFDNKLDIHTCMFYHGPCLKINHGEMDNLNNRLVKKLMSTVCIYAYILCFLFL